MRLNNLKYFFYLFLVTSLLGVTSKGYAQASGVQISWDFSVGCQVYSNEEPRDGKNPIFIEEIAENECLLTCSGQVVTYTLSGNLGSNPSTTWNINGGDILLQSDTQVTVEWGAMGNGFLSFAVDNGTETITKTICIEKIARPKADFSIIPTVPLRDGGGYYACSLQTIYFENLSEVGNGSPIMSYLWDFGDGSTSTAFEPTHSYNTPGSYMVSLTVTNACGCSSSAKLTIQVERKGFDIKCPSVVCEGETSTYSLPFDGQVVCQGAYNWSVDGGTIQNVDPVSGDVTVVWDQVDENGFGYVTFNPGECALRCLIPSTVKVPVVLSNGTIDGPTEICLGQQYKYTMPQWPTTDFQWEILDGNNGNNVNIILTDQRNEIFLEPRQTGLFELKVVYKNTLLHCGGVAILKINVTKPYAISGPEALCSGANGHFEEAGGNSVNWQLLGYTGNIITTLNGSDNFSYVFTTPGNYSLVVSGTNTCPSEPKLIKVISAPTAPGAITGPVEICPGVPYTYSVSGYNPAFTYQWQAPTNGTIQGSDTGPQVVVVFDTNTSHGVSVVCQTISPISCISPPSTLAVSNKQIPAIVDGPLIACGNSTGNYKVNFEGTTNLYDEGETYTWSLSNTAVGSIISGQNTNSISVMWNNVTTITTVSLHCVIQKCTLIEDFFIEVEVRPTPTIAISGYTGPVCSGLDIPLTVVSTDPLNPLDAGSTVNWTSNLAPLSGGLNQSFQYENTSNGNSIYTITAQIMNPNGCGNSTNIASVQVTILPAPDVSISLYSGGNAFCEEWQIDSWLTVAASNSPALQWYHDGSMLTGVTGTSYLPTTFGVYTVVATNPVTGCQNTSNLFHVFRLNCNSSCTIDPIPMVTNTSTVSCNASGDGYSTLYLSGTATQLPNPPVDDYYDIIGPVSTAHYTGTTLPVTVAGIYNVMHRAKYECGSGYTVFEDREDLLVPYIPQFNYSAVCNGTGNSSFTITVADNTDFFAPIGNRSWAYSIKPTGAPDSSYVPMLGTANGSFSGTFPSGNYTIKLVVGGTLYGSSLPLCEVVIGNIILQTIPNMVINNSTVFCHDTAVSFITVPNIPNLNYTWNLSNNVTNNLAIPQHVFESYGSHTVGVTVENRFGCSRILTPVTVTIPPECFNGDIVASPTDATVCAGGSVTLTYVPNGTECGASYQWMDELTPITGANSFTYTPNSEGIYWVKLRSAQNCTYSSPSRIAPVFRLPPSVQLDGNTVFCENNTQRIIKAITPAGNSLSWQVDGQPYGTANSTEVDLAGLTVGTYTLTVTVTDSFGCQNTAGATIMIIPVPAVPLVDYSFNSCSPYLVDVFVLNQSSTGVYNWSNGMTGVFNTLTNGGPIQIMHTDGGCTVSSDTKNIPKDPAYYEWIFPSGCIDACAYKEETGYLIGPRLELYSWNWWQDSTVAAGGVQSFPDPFELQQSGIYQLSYNTGLCNLITQPLDYAYGECAKCEVIKSIVVDSLTPNEFHYCSFALDLKIENNSSTPITVTVVSPGPDVTIIPSTVTLQPGSAVYSFTVIPIDMVNGGSVTLFFEGIGEDGKPCLTDFTFTLPGCGGEAISKTLAEGPENNLPLVPRQLLVVPNPVQGPAEVQFESAVANPTLTLYDLTGRPLDAFSAIEAKGRWRLNLDRYPAGVYIVVLRENGQLVKQQKVIKE
ncbi:PKD domain-containing protein [Flavobacterium sedimenticola]|uniref:PKD domain-containing protein n=1 Tax=Flavobacterium sedimenticola TaxID=3043286 RepID=A0ABT6XR29_9FLAO|nr:PKD domain-containing protein [Flavobacterium sedimenticola]MDI9257540.1 PKD domain-containing protein [Flavobacterium sedimenticola]